MKVYHVVHTDYGEHSIYATFSTLELAVAFVEKANAARVMESLRVEEYEVNDAQEPVIEYSIDMLANGETENVGANLLSPGHKPEDRVTPWGDGTAWATSSKSINHAKKLARKELDKRKEAMPGT